MKPQTSDSISQIATWGSVTFVTARIALDVVTAQWANLGMYALLFATLAWFYIRVIGTPIDTDSGDTPSMGLDFMDLVFRFERTFKIKIDRTATGGLQAAGVMNGRQWDIRVRDLVAFIESHVRVQNPAFEGDVFEMLKPDIAVCLGVDETEVTLDSWMVADLGMS